MNNIKKIAIHSNFLYTKYNLYLNGYYVYVFLAKDNYNKNDKNEEQF